MEVSSIGLCVMKPYHNHLKSHPHKLYEYMSAGLCSLVSDFELWKNLVNNTNSGVSCDPLSPEDIAKKIELILNDPGLLETCRQNGIEAIKNTYNWGIEEIKLTEFYNGLYLEQSK